MQLLWDFIRRTFYMSVFIIPLPIGSYTIHNGSSAMAALVSYLVLSLFIPFFYFRSPKSGFGLQHDVRVKPLAYILAYFIVQAITYLIFSQVELTMLWSLPTIGRDIVFIIVMYIQVLSSVILGCGVSRIF